jgi:hypothetical protein
MKIIGIIIVLAFAITACRTKNSTAKVANESSSDRIIERIELPDHYNKTLAEIAQSCGCSMETTIRCVHSSTLDMGSHTWIYCYDESGQFSHAILFRWSDHENYDPHHKPVDGKTIKLQVFRETIENEVLVRTELFDDEIDKELNKITDYLIEYLGEPNFKFYSEGGMIPELTAPDELGNEPVLVDDPVLVNDPFAVTEQPKTNEQKRQFCIQMSQNEAAHIARFIYYYRTPIKGVEEVR